jgi:hypothetical protein
MLRARPFIGFLTVIAGMLPDPFEQQKYIALSQSSLDLIDPITWAPHVIEQTLEPGPASRRVLMQIGIGDTSVPNLASHLHARALGLPLLGPAFRSLPLLATLEGPLEGSALAEYEFGVPRPLPGDQAIPPPSETIVHEALRRLPSAQRQIDEFLRPGGAISNFCEGVCDPE